ncbi:hypothetical protein [Paenibacillus tengchongensis]|uniref:hypothetical protein n=1 Tax=Paenibacillus tengchongensis TaxID=2608684 RepID=UPI00124BF77E|nr:hypothetical protein [Paenibacillus tengchongensis]
MTKKLLGAAAVITNEAGQILQDIPQPASPEILECGYFRTTELPKPISDFTIQRIVHAASAGDSGLFHRIGPRQWIE